MNEQQKFEAWCRDTLEVEPADLETRTNGDWIEYVNDHIETLWNGWMGKVDSTAPREADAP
jgi:hypothetical protein